MKAGADLKTLVRRYWDEKPCGIKNTSAEPGTLAFYEAVETHRYREEFHIPFVAEFNDHPGERVVEIGCGLGTDGRQFARGGTDYVGCDLSMKSLVLARQGFTLFNLPGKFVNADAENLPFPDESFDLVYSHGVLHHVPETERAVSEVHRVLRSAGKAIVMLYARESFGYFVGAQTYGRIRLEIKRLRMGRKAFNQFVGLDPEHRRWLPNWVVINNSTDGLGNPLSKLYTKEQLATMFRGFREIQLEKHYFPRRKVPFIGSWLSRPITARLGHLCGSFWYVKAIK